MLNILLMIILIIILFIIILLLIGIRISLIYEKIGRNINGCLKILIFKKIKVYSSEFPKKDEDEKEEEDKDEDKEHDIKKIYNLAKPCFEDLKIYVEQIFKSMNISKLENHLIFGLDSYASTAKYIGMLWAIQSILNNMHKNAYFTAEPSFNGSVLDMKGDNQLEIKPLKLVVPTIKLLSKKEVRSLIRGVLNERR